MQHLYLVKKEVIIDYIYNTYPMQSPQLYIENVHVALSISSIVGSRSDKESQRFREKNT